MNKIAIIGQFPPPLHGLSKALETLYKSDLNKKYVFIKFDITNNKKILHNLVKIIFNKCDLYYFTISQSKMGNLRDLIFIILIKLKRKKIIIHLHGGGFREVLDNEFSYFQKSLNYKILSRVDRAIVLGNSLKYIFENIIPTERIHIVKNCVDNQFLISQAEFEKKIIKFSARPQIKVLYMSNFIKEKGYLDVLNLSLIFKKNQNNSVKFIFAGKFFDKKDEIEFSDFIKKNNLQTHVEYKGVVSGKEKLKLLKECDIFILLTSYKNEGQPISIIEAAANGLVVITTNHAGILDILSRDEMIVLEKDRIDLNKIYTILRDKDKIEKIDLRYNRDNILKCFSERKYLNDLEDIFDENL